MYLWLPYARPLRWKFSSVSYWQFGKVVYKAQFACHSVTIVYRLQQMYLLVRYLYVSGCRTRDLCVESSAAFLIGNRVLYKWQKLRIKKGLVQKIWKKFKLRRDISHASVTFWIHHLSISSSEMCVWKIIDLILFLCMVMKLNVWQQIIIIIYLFTTIGLLPGGSGYFTCLQNIKSVTTEFKSGELHEKHVVATWNVGNRLSICL
jgi:hypothetical protein